jgi:hypothetical protein
MFFDRRYHAVRCHGNFARMSVITVMCHFLKIFYGAKIGKKNQSSVKLLVDFKEVSVPAFGFPRVQFERSAPAVISAIFFKNSCLFMAYLF